MAKAFRVNDNVVTVPMNYRGGYIPLEKALKVQQAAAIVVLPDDGTRGYYYPIVSQLSNPVGEIGDAFENGAAYILREGRSVSFVSRVWASTQYDYQAHLIQADGFALAIDDNGDNFIFLFSYEV